MHLPSKPIDTVTRPLRFRFHIGEDWTIPLNDKIGVIISSDFALFYEDAFHPAINIGAGINLWKVSNNASLRIPTWTGAGFPHYATRIWA
jgi:hypothetical protein